MSAAFLFPGQGSQVPGMLHTLPDHPAIGRTLDEVSESLGENVLELDSTEALRSTVSVQLALLASGVGVARALIAEGVEPEAVAGMSVGAFAAVVGLTEKQVSTLVEAAYTEQNPVYVGNINAPRQIVIAGSDEGMNKVLEA